MILALTRIIMTIADTKTTRHDAYVLFTLLEMMDGHIIIAAVVVFIFS